VAGSSGGAALLSRGLAKKDLGEVVGASGGPRIIEFDKSIRIDASVPEVYAVWTDYQHFPRFMSHLKDVRDLGNGRSHWVAEGPAGLDVSWEAEITQQVPNRLLAWRS